MAALLIDRAAIHHHSLAGDEFMRVAGQMVVDVNRCSTLKFPGGLEMVMAPQSFRD
ncbi:MAG: hypothetical protein ACJAU6_002576 [Alphaproteobacteria bacterium]|jgi:hypothetical protein